MTTVRAIVSVFVVLLSIGMGAPAMAASSVYTSASIDKGCTTVGTPSQEDIDMGSMSLKCGG